jgi:hypothetical protein
MTYFCQRSVLGDEILRARAIETLQIFGGSRDSGSQ